MKKRNLFVVLLIVAMLIASMSASVFACGGYYYQPKTAKYTVQYKEYGTNIQLAPSVTKSALAGKTVTETAISIDKYTVYGASTKSLYISKCRCNIITFYYVKQKTQLTDYTVRYLEINTEKVLAPEKKVKDLEVGKEVTEEAIDIEGYRLVGDKTQTITLKGGKSSSSSNTYTKSREGALQVALAHAGLSRSSIIWMDIETERSCGKLIYEIDFECVHGYEYEYIIDCATGSIIGYEFEDGVCSKCNNANTESMLKCRPQSQEEDQRESKEGINVITFYYEAKAVEYVSTKVEKKWVNSKGEEMAWPEGQTVTVNVTYGEDSEELTLDADHPVIETKKFKKVDGGKFAVDEVDIDGYTVTVTENSDGTFTLTNTEDVRLTEYVVKYLDEDGFSIENDKIVTDVEVGAEITEVAKTLDGYIALSPTEKTLIMQESGNVFEFIYRWDKDSVAMTSH